jgi:hypothetical protein
VSDEADWWPAAKLFGRYLTPWMAARGLAEPVSLTPAARYA